MKKTVLLVDSGLNLKQALKPMLEDSGLLVASFGDLPAAKRKLLEIEPCLVLCKLSFPDDPEAGIKFCRELAQHPTLSSVPVILVEKQVTDDFLRKATACGAKGLVNWPTPDDALKRRLMPYVPELGTANKALVKTEREAAAQKEAAKASLSVNKAESRSFEEDDRFKLAQGLLAKVLHNLKTSDLLRVAEIEDVPRVVFEITRSVCGIKGGAAADESSTAGAKARQNNDVSVDLGAIFDLKK